MDEMGHDKEDQEGTSDGQNDEQDDTVMKEIDEHMFVHIPFR